MRHIATFIGLLALGLIAPLLAGAAPPARAAQSTPAADCPQTTEAENQAIVERWYRSIETSDWDGIRAVFAPGATQDAADFTDASGVEAIVESMAGFVSAFPDLRHDVEQWFLDDDLVAARVVGTGTHLGEFQGIAPTGKEVSWTIIPIFRIECGRIAEHWTELSAFNRLVALGAVANPLASASPRATSAPEVPSSVAPPASPAAACPATSEADNAALIERWYDEVWTQANFDNIEDFLATDQAHHRVMERYNSGAEARIATLQR